jgi:hypothetical protein
MIDALIVLSPIIILGVMSAFGYYRLSKWSDFCMAKLDEACDDNTKCIPDIVSSYENYDKTWFWNFKFDEMIVMHDY